MNYDDPVFCQMITDILSGAYRGGFLIATDPTRIARFGVQMIERICEFGGCEIVYCLQDHGEKDSQSELCLDVLACLCHFTAKASGQKAAKINTKHLEPEVLQEAYRRYKAGHSWFLIAEQFKSEGIRGAKGEKLTHYVIQQRVEENLEVLEATCPVSASEANSFLKFVAARISKKRGARTDRKAIMVAYRDFCEENNLRVLSGKGVGRTTDSLKWVRKFNRKGATCFADVVLD